VNISGASGSISINGRTIEIRGNNLYVNGRLYVPSDGPAPEIPPTPSITLDRDGQINGDIHGDLVVHATGPVTLVVKGNIDGSVQCDGNVTCESVGGSATAGNDIQTDRVGGSANAGHDITASRIGGSANAGRDIHRS
jgi:hypothetical protein